MVTPHGPRLRAEPRGPLRRAWDSATRPCSRFSALPTAGAAGTAAALWTRTAQSALSATRPPGGRGCGDCGGVGVTPRTAFVLHRQLKDLADKTYLAARCLAESVLLGHAVSGVGGFSIESVCADEVYQTLPASRFDYDWEFLANESGLLDVSDRAHDFLEADVAEDDLWDEWFKPYTDVEPRGTTPGGGALDSEWPFALAACEVCLGAVPRAPIRPSASSRSPNRRCPEPSARPGASTDDCTRSPVSRTALPTMCGAS